jgi:transcriptional regulator with XRE-family HTH domain
MPYLEKFKAAREEKKLSLATIAMLSNTSLPTVTRFFQGNGKRLSVDTVASIASILDVSLDEAFGIGEPVQKPLDPNIEVLVNSYTDLIKEKDERLKEQEETIEQLKIDKVKMQKEKSKVLSFALVFATVIIFILLFDMMNGHFGYFRY